MSGMEVPSYVQLRMRVTCVLTPSAARGVVVEDQNYTRLLEVVESSYR